MEQKLLNSPALERQLGNRAVCSGAISPFFISCTEFGRTLVLCVGLTLCPEPRGSALLYLPAQTLVLVLSKCLDKIFFFLFFFSVQSSPCSAAEPGPSCRTAFVGTAQPLLNFLSVQSFFPVAPSCQHLVYAWFIWRKKKKKDSSSLQTISSF